MKARNIILIAALALLAACSSSPEPHEIQPPMATARTPARTDIRAEPATGMLVPIDRWRRNLALLLPMPWHFEVLEAQIAAPDGYTRISGDRGVAVWLTDGTERQVFWLMPRDFKGRIVQPKVLATAIAQNDQLLLFSPKTDAKGWQATDEVKAALGLGGAGGELARVRRVATADMQAIGKAVETFKGDVGYYPVRLTDLWRLPTASEGTWKGPYLDHADPQDPWGSEYAYSAMSDSFQLISYGADGAPGGENADRDLTGGSSLQK